MKKYSYVAVSFTLLIFGIIFVPRIVDRISDGTTTRQTRLSHQSLSYITLDGEVKKVPDFLFTNQDNLLISNEDFLGKVYVAEFFFSTCPTICPIMNTNMKRLEEVFGTRDDFGIASFTIDPQTDTPERLKRYAERYEVFSPNWHFLTGDKEQVFQLANKGFNIFTSINPKVAGGFEHQGYFALIDKKGYIRSRADSFGNPIVYYLGIDEEGVLQQGTQMLLEDIEKLLNDE